MEASPCAPVGKGGERAKKRDPRHDEKEFRQGGKGRRRERGGASASKGTAADRTLETEKALNSTTGRHET